MATADFHSLLSEVSALLFRARKVHEHEVAALRSDLQRARDDPKSFASEGSRTQLAIASPPCRSPAPWPPDQKGTALVTSSPPRWVTPGPPDWSQVSECAAKLSSGSSCKAPDNVVVDMEEIDWMTEKEGEPEIHHMVSSTCSMMSELQGRRNRTKAHASTDHGEWTFPVWTEWTEKPASNSSPSFDRSRTTPLGDLSTPLGDFSTSLGEPLSKWGDTVHSSRRCSRLVVLHPDKAPRLACWVMGGALLGYDVICIPLTVFQSEFSDISSAMSLVALIWWTLDVPLNFLAGYHQRGLIEMRPYKIAIYYMKGWLAIDVLICSLDWVVLILDNLTHSEDSVFVRYGRAIRTIRLLRLARLVRLLKFTDFLKQRFSDIMNAANVFGIILMVLLVSHYIACTWYAVGLASATTFRASWTDGIHTGESAYYRYTTSLHWSLCQITPATNGINPSNSYERSFAICVVIFALVAFSSFVGSISAKITEIRQAKSKRVAEEAHLRDYLSTRRVGLEVGHRIWVFLRTSPKKVNRRMHESDIKLLQEIPKSLRTELRAQVYLPIIASHRLFHALSNASASLVMAVCDQATSDCSYSPLQDVFVEGDTSTSTYFVVQGSLEYRTLMYEHPVRVGSELSAISEAALWGEWVHCGRMTAETNVELVALHAGTFRKVCTRSAVSDAAVLGMLRKYAALFADAISDLSSTSITDVVLDLAVTGEFVSGAFPSIGFKVGLSSFTFMGFAAPSLRLSRSSGCSSP